ncbi:MAG TPA: MFS transporter, partial [Polyangiaceae bacterium LLY-WYZ-15_(1-7)]|nr:MFS transporter [Polyangiaceae bacterium LLY-WYZ-15_(1-7)]
MLALLRSRRFAPLFWTQLLGAFNDNVFKSALVVALTFGAFRDGAALETDALVNLATALLVLPFFLFSAFAGQLADRLDKATLTRALKATELGVMLLALVGFQLASLPLLFGALFLMGTQSAFLGPVKYAILPQHLEEDELLGANGLVEMGTFVAILAGTLIGALVVAIPGAGVPLVGGLLVANAAAGWAVARRVPAAPPLRRAPIDWNPIRSTATTLRVARRDRAVWGAILGASWFWAVGAFFLGQLPRLAETLGGDERALTWMLAAFSLGIGAGSVLTEKLAGGRHALGVVPLAGVGMAAAALSVADASTVAEGCLRLAGLGLAGGVFVVPLYAAMQAGARAEERSQVIAANNIVNAGFMVAAAVYATLRLGAGVELRALVREVAALHLAVTALVLIALRATVLRLLLARLVHLVYRVDVKGLREHLPAEGAALVVANHASFVDAFVLEAVSPRPIRFVMDHRMARLPGLAWLFRLARVIPIASRKHDPALLAAAWEAIDEALATGEVVCVFPEGKCTRDGEVDVFRPGVERILARRPVPVVP